MKKKFPSKTLILFIFLLVFFIPLLSAQGKLRVAVVNFENKSTWHHWGNRLGEAAADVFVTDLLNTGKFTVIEREKLDAVLQEQDLGASGAVTPQTAAKIGKLLGVDLIMTGSVSQFSISKAGGGLRGVRLGVTTGKVVMQARLVNTSTGEIVVATEAENKKRLVGASIRGARFYQDFDYGLANEVMHPAVEKMVAEIVSKSAGMSPAAKTGRIIKVEGTKVWVNLGAGSGVKAGDVFDVYRKGEELIDPETGLSLGAEEEKVGKIIITEVKAKYSIGSIQGGDVQAKDFFK